MREEIIEVILRGFGLGWSEQEIADAILAIPVGNATLGEVLEMLPGMVKAMADEMCPDCLSLNDCEIKPRGGCLPYKALTLKSGKLLEVGNGPPKLCYNQRKEIP